MKYLLIFLIAFNIINAQTEITVSDLQLSKHSVLGVEKINNKLFIVSHNGDQGLAVLDVYNVDKNTIEKDILKNSGETISFGNAKLFKDRQNNLWIGDINRLLKLDLNGDITNIYKDVDLPDSTFFEIKSITEDDKGNIYFLKVNTKTIYVEKIDGTKYSAVVSDLDLVKFNGVSFEILLNVKGIFDVRGIKFFENKIYFSHIKLGEKNIGLHYFDLSKNELYTFKNEFPTFKEIPSLDWEKVDRVIFDKFFVFENDLYAYVKIDGSFSNFSTFVKINHSTNEIEYIDTYRKEKGSGVMGITAFYVLNDKIICKTTEAENNLNRVFMEFKDNNLDFIPIPNNLKCYLITNHGVKSEIENNNAKIEDAKYIFNSELYLTKNGSLIGGTRFGLLVIENFQQPSSNVEKQEINIKTIPDLISVKNEFYIESEFIINSYKVFDLNSKILQTASNLNSKNVNLNLDGLTIGIYFIEIETQRGSKLLKFIKN